MKDFFSNHDKGDVLKFLETKLQNVRILPQYKFSIHNYNNLKKQKILTSNQLSKNTPTSIITNIKTIIVKV